jgi:hypothetical protein
MTPAGGSFCCPCYDLAREYGENSETLGVQAPAVRWIALTSEGDKTTF